MKRNLRNEFDKRQRKGLKRLVSMIMVMVVMSSMAVQAFCATTGSSLLLEYPEVRTTIEGFAGQIIPTVLEIVAIVVGVGLTLWAIGFAIKKGISVMQKNAKKAL